MRFVPDIDSLTTSQTLVNRALESAWKESAGATIILVHGPSASGKTHLAQTFLELRKIHSRAPEELKDVIYKAVNWSALDDSRIEESLSEGLYRGSKNLKDALDSILYDIKVSSLGSFGDDEDEPRSSRHTATPIFVINDLEVAMSSTSQKSFLLDEVLKAFRESPIHPFVILTSIVELDESYVQKEAQKSLGLVNWPELFGTLGETHIPREPDDRALRLKPSALALALVKDLKESGDSSIVETISQVAETYKRSIEGMLEGSEEFQGVQEDFTCALHSALYFRASAKQGRAVSRVFRYLLCWASVDPGFDFWQRDTYSGLQIDDWDESGLKRFFFKNDTYRNSPRLAHRSVLDLYAPTTVDRHIDFTSWPFEHDRADIHLKCALLIDQYAEVENNVERRDRLKIAVVRHRLRTDKDRSWEGLRLLDPERFDLPGSAKHELSYALDDFRYPWISKNMRVRERRANYWYTPPHDVPGALKRDELLRVTAELLYWDGAYQALDEWDDARDASRDLYKELKDRNQIEWELATVGESIQPEDGLLPAVSDLRTDKYWDCRCLAAGLYGTMIYEVGDKRDGVDVDTARYKARASYKLLRSFSRELPEYRRSDIDRDPLYLNLRSNQFVAGLKCLPARLSNFSQQRYDLLLDKIAEEYSSLIDYLSEPQAIYRGSASDQSEVSRHHSQVLDKARYKLNYSRWIFLRGKDPNSGIASDPSERGCGATLAAEYLKREVLDASREDWYQASQEWFYAYVQHRFYLLYAGQVPKFDVRKEEHQEAMDKNGDTWAKYQLEVVSTWLDSTVASDRSELSRRLLQIAKRFDMDPKAATACRFQSLFLTLDQTEGRSLAFQKLCVSTGEGFVSTPAFADEDRFYRLAVDYACGERTFAGLVQRWFATDRLLACPPIMPAMLILRGFPMSYVPRTKSQ